MRNRALVFCILASLNFYSLSAQETQPSPGISTSPTTSPSATPTPSPTPPALTDVFFKNLKARSIGPAVMGGRVSDIAIDPRNPFVFYVGLGHGGVFKTNDNGVTFQPIFDKQP